jgi:hypothetical protein
LAADVKKHAYDLFVEDRKVITDNSYLCGVILVLGDFNLPKVRWKVDEESDSVVPLNVTTNLENGIIGGLLGCDLDQTNVVPNDIDTFLDLVYTNAAVEVSVSLKLSVRHKSKSVDNR